MSRLSVAIVEDDPVMGESLLQRLSLEGYPCRWLRNGEEALAAFARERPGAVICDIRLPDLDGEQLFRRAVPHLGPTPVIFITAFGELEQAVRLMRAGADDFLTKPFSIEQLLARLSAFSARNSALEDCTDQTALGTSEPMRRLQAVLSRIADLDSPVLLRGETGAGKEHLARHMHRISRRAGEPFTVVTCASLSGADYERPIFGATARFDRVDGAPTAGTTGNGIIFLDEVADLALDVQAKLLRAIETGRYVPSDATQEVPFGRRVIAATNADLPRHIHESRFRQDLYFRLSVVEVVVPPLRERVADILPLARDFLSAAAAQIGAPCIGFSSGAEAELVAYQWPGNVRELRNRIIQAVALAGDKLRLPAADLFPEAATPPDAVSDRLATLSEARADAERRHIQTALRDTKGEIGRAASLLGVSRTTLWDKMRRLKLAAEDS